MALRTNLFVVALALALFGNVMVYSATSKELGTHYLVVRFAHLAIGLIAFLVAKQVRYTAWRKIAPAFYVVVLVSLVLVLFPSLGTEVGGARRWFDLGYFSLQPAEFAKLAQPGESSTASPGRAAFCARATVAVRSVSRKTFIPSPFSSKNSKILGPASPWHTTARQHLSIGPNSSEKSVSFSEPPRIKTTGPLKLASAAATAAGLVASESST